MTYRLAKKVMERLCSGDLPNHYRHDAVESIMQLPQNDANDNPYQSPKSSGSYVPFPDRLIRSGWLYRKVELAEPYNATIEYNGRGFGYEKVLLNGEVVARKMSFRWFVPHFEFNLSTQLGDRTVTVDVRVRPWLVLHRITIRIAGALVYVEGTPIAESR